MAQTLEDLSDESLMERIQKNDHRAFSVLVERRTDMFYAAAYRMVMNQQDAEDITQDAFLKIWNRPNLWKAGKGARFTTWFYHIVMNLSLDILRKNKHRNVLYNVDHIGTNADNQEHSVIMDEEQKVLQSAMKNLPEKQLTALNLCFYEELSNKEAADIMNIKVKALESLLMRAKSGIKTILIREGLLKQGDIA